MSLLEDLVIASRTCAEHGVIDAYGHVSVRSDRDPNRYFLSRAIAPELITEPDLLEYDLDSRAVVDGGPAGYNERFIHGEIYKLRPDVNSIVHNHSHSVVPFSCVSSCQLRPIFHMSAFIGRGIPNWDIRDAQHGSDMLVRNSMLGRSLAEKLGAAPAALMRGHGSVTVGEKVQIAVGRSVYLDINAKMQYQAMMMAGGQSDAVIYLDDDEVSANLAWQEYGRSWDLWKKKWLLKLAAEKV